MIKLFMELFCITFVKSVPSIEWNGTNYIVPWQDEERCLNTHHKCHELQMFSPNVRINCDTSWNQEMPFLGLNGGNIYVVWQDSSADGWSTRFSKSTNGGTNWLLSNPSINDEAYPHRVYPSIVAGGGDTLYTAWQNGWFLDKSINCGDNWGIDAYPREDTGLASIVVPRNCSFKVDGDNIYIGFLASPPPNPFPDFQVWFVKSEDGGINWTDEKKISNSPQGGCWNVSLAMDEQKNLYMVWEDRGIGFSKSTNGGLSWTSPTYSIADSGYKYPCITARGNGELFVSWMWKSNRKLCFTKSNDGGTNWTHPNIYIDEDLHINPAYVYGIFNIPSIYADGANLYIAFHDSNNVYFTMSSDTGLTWAPRDTVSDTNTGKRQAPVLRVDDNGNAHIVWMDERNGDWDIYFSTRKITGVEAEDSSPAFYTAVTPNPFIQKTVIKFRVQSSEFTDKRPLTLRIHDLSGRLIRSLPIHDSRFTIHEITWDGRDELGGVVPSGVYFIKLKTGNYSLTEKIIKLE